MGTTASVLRMHVVRRESRRVLAPEGVIVK